MFHTSNADDLKFGAFNLRRAIVPDGDMEPSDVMRAKSALGRLGHFDIAREKLNGYPGRPLTEGVKSFQREQGLTVDGLMNPDGPSARRLTSLIGDMNQTDGIAADDSDVDADAGLAAISPTGKAPWFKSTNLKPLSDEDASANGCMLGGLLKYNVNGDLPNLFADALMSGGAKSVHEFADFLRQLSDARADRVAGFESEVMAKLTGGERNRIKRLAEGPAPATPPRTLEQRQTMEFRPETDRAWEKAAPALHRDGMVYENGQWRAQTKAEKAQEGLQLLTAEGGNAGEGADGGGEQGLEAGVPGNNTAATKQRSTPASFKGPRKKASQEETKYPLLYDGETSATGDISEGGYVPEVLAEDEERKQRRDLTNERKQSILSDAKTQFFVLPNPKADGEKPLIEIGSFSEVEENKSIIERKAKETGVDPNLVKAIIHMETTHGQYDRIPALVDAQKSIRPMNIHASYWKGLGYSREDLKNPEKNMEAGVKLLKSIQDRMPDASTEQISEVYNFLGATIVGTYGARVGQLYRKRPWEK
jgi:hypothetical protein